MPDTSVDAEVIRDAVQLACRAPSLHNTQPWRWVARDAVLRLFLDPSRVIRSADNSGREALISCGAVLDHLRAALAAAGWATEIDRFPDAGNRDHLATVRLSPAPEISARDRRLADAILARRTDRLPLSSPPGWPELEQLLHAVLPSRHIHLDVLGAEARAELAEVSSLTESLRQYDSTYHAELDWWTAPFEDSEGIPHSALVSAAESDRVELNRSFPVTGHSERRTAIDGDEAMVLVLSTDNLTREYALLAGETMSGLLLECTAAGLATCTVTHVTELAAGRDVVSALIDRDGFPQLLIRVGIAPALEHLPPPTPRRALHDVLQLG